MAPTEFANRGTYALFRDPEGALFGVLHSDSGDPPDRDFAEIGIGDFLWMDLFARDPSGSAEFYRHLAGRTSMRTPAIYANEISDDRQLSITLMEDMAPAEPGSQLIGESREHARVAMAEAAKLAAAFYGDDSVEEYDFVMTQAKDDGGAFGQSLLQQYWPAFLERFGSYLSEECLSFGSHYAWLVVFLPLGAAVVRHRCRAGG